MTIALGNGGEKPYADINMTPLIDVMLVLLIIFIITIPTMTHGLKIDNPLRTRVPTPVSEVIELHIDFDGTLVWNDAIVDRATLQHRITALASRSPQPEVHIAVDKFAKYEVVAQTLADIQSRGLEKIGFVNHDFF